MDSFKARFFYSMCNWSKMVSASQCLNPTSANSRRDTGLTFSTHIIIWLKILHVKFDFFFLGGLQAGVNQWWKLTWKFVYTLFSLPDCIANWKLISLSCLLTLSFTLLKRKEILVFSDNNECYPQILLSSSHYAFPPSIIECYSVACYTPKKVIFRVWPMYCNIYK